MGDPVPYHHDVEEGKGAPGVPPSGKMLYEEREPLPQTKQPERSSF